MHHTFSKKAIRSTLHKNEIIINYQAHFKLKTVLQKNATYVRRVSRDSS